MSLTGELVSIEAAAHMAEVSIGTLKKYIELGLIKSVPNDSAETMLYQLELNDLFSLGEQKPNANLNSTQKKNTKDISPLQKQIRSEFTKQDLASNKSDSKGTAAESRENLNTQRSDFLDSNSSLEIIEINRNLRERIKDLREERDWLRERLESAESRSEREQTLLLSESENLRQALKNLQKGNLHHRLNPKGFFQALLPWK